MGFVILQWLSHFALDRILFPASCIQSLLKLHNDISCLLKCFWLHWISVLLNHVKTLIKFFFGSQTYASPVVHWSLKSAWQLFFDQFKIPCHFRELFFSQASSTFSMLVLNLVPLLFFFEQSFWLLTPFTIRLFFHLSPISLHLGIIFKSLVVHLSNVIFNPECLASHVFHHLLELLWILIPFALNPSLKHLPFPVMLLFPLRVACLSFGNLLMLMFK
jgi:hypothetical protein